MPDPEENDVTSGLLRIFVVIQNVHISAELATYLLE